MADTQMGLRTKIPDISRRPTRIQDIPRETLGMYGIVIVNEEGMVSDSDEEDSTESGRLVIDESDFKPNVKSEEGHKMFFNELEITSVTDVGKKTSAINRREIQQTIQQFQISTSKELKDIRDIAYCKKCKKLTSDSLAHNKKHCFFDGCPDIIENERDRERHKKMHDHPTKPLQCKFCKKRYRYQSYIEKHALYCKAKRKAPTAKENWRRETAKANYF